MCVHFNHGYQSCPHTAEEPCIFQCSDPSKCGQLTVMNIILGVDDVTGFPDFCPQCLLAGGLFNDSLDDAARAKIKSIDYYREFGVRFPMAARMWKGAEDDPANTLEEDAFITGHRPFPSDLTHDIVKDVYRILTCSFWQAVIDHKVSPTRFQRLLLVQVHAYMVSYAMEDVALSINLRYDLKHLRPVQLMGLVTPVDIGSLPGEDRNCSICRELLGVSTADGVTENPVRTQCDHILGENCLGSWITENETCPFCRRELLTFAATHATFFEAREVARARQPLPTWVHHILGIDQSNVEAELGTISELGLEGYLLSKNTDLIGYDKSMSTISADGLSGTPGYDRGICSLFV